MGWYRRGNLALSGFRILASRVSPQNPNFQHHSRICQSGGYFDSCSKGVRFNGFSSFSSLSHNRFGTLGVKVYNNLQNPLLSGARRFYCVDARNVQHFRSRGPKCWFQSRRNVFIIVMIGSGFLITVYFWNLEIVPYTHRTHCILVSKTLERSIGEMVFDDMKADFKGKILPPIHPESVRVRMIAKEIIDALQRGLWKEQVWSSDMGYASSEHRMMVQGGDGNETLKALVGGEGKVQGGWHRKDEILDDRLVQQSRKNKGQERGSQPATSHLEGLNWEVLVVNDPDVNAVCLPSGKIFVFTGLLEHFRTDAEIATIIGHEVGHAVARHGAERMTKFLWFAIHQLILDQFDVPDIVSIMLEMEADYIGLLLIASAGYDPRVAPQVYEKFGKISGESPHTDYDSTHPSGKKRAELLAQAKIMEEALSIYRNAIAGRWLRRLMYSWACFYDCKDWFRHLP